MEVTGCIISHFFNDIGGSKRTESQRVITSLSICIRILPESWVYLVPIVRIPVQFTVLGSSWFLVNIISGAILRTRVYFPLHMQYKSK